MRLEILKRIALYVRTAMYMKPRQVAYFIYRRMLPQFSLRYCDHRGYTTRTIHLAVSPRYGVRATDAGEFCFLNTCRHFPDQVDWVCGDMQKLWRYNLHYFDYAQNSGRPRERIADLVTNWISQCPQGMADAWEPYTVSLRTVNWIKLFLDPDFRSLVQTQWLESLYAQACWLERNIEYHILANHYLKNGKSLLFLGAYFAGNDAERWLNRGLTILVEEADEQILPDGGHYERSPMYHSIVTEDYLDVVNLLLSNPGLADKSIIDHFLRKTLAALDFLSETSFPDSEIPLFNDSAFQIARSPREIFNYAQRLIDYTRPLLQEGLSVIEKPESGYYIIRNGADMIIVDCGIIGPDYQPGHAHCDTLSYELAIDGRRVIVDSGVHDYEIGTHREYARSTRAHNTVSVDGCEQSEIWGVFRVGRRARPISASARRIDGKRACFKGLHDGFRYLPGSVVHSRTVDYDVEDGWTVEDNLSGSGRHQMESFIHLHPDLNASVIEDKILLSDVSGMLIATIEVPGGVDIELAKSWYFPEFGKKMDNAMITIRKSGVLPLRTQYKIRKIPAA